ncbi:MAG: hypothetical protein ABIJ56_04245 [Pseudomonadota bacterium]
MNVKHLKDIPPWDWPEHADAMILETLRDERADGADRAAAVELAGTSAVINDELAEALAAVLESGNEKDELRARAAISLGPALEQANMEGFDDPDDELISEKEFRKIRDLLHGIYGDADVPVLVRRRALEASVRAPMDWHEGAVRAAWSSGERDWRLTAVFCMSCIRGFNDEILEALGSEDEDIHYEAVGAAGSWALQKAWKHVSALAASDGTEKGLRIAAIEAASFIRPKEAAGLLGHLADCDDEDIAGATIESLTLAGGMPDDDGDIDDEDEEDENDRDFN